MTTTTHHERTRDQTTEKRPTRRCPDCGAPFSTTHGAGRCFVGALTGEGAERARPARFEEHDPRGPRAPTGVFLEVFGAIILAVIVIILGFKVLATYGLI